MKVSIYAGEKVEVTGINRNKIVITFLTGATVNDLLQFNYYPDFPDTSTETPRVLLFKNFRINPGEVTIAADPNEQAFNYVLAFMLDFNTASQFTITRINNVVTITANNGSQLVEPGIIGSFATIVNPIETNLEDTYRKLDLYEDENISLTSKLSDIEKLSNIFTDFSDSFTLPASSVNNEVFRHYYNYDIDNAFNANLRIPAYIEIDTIPFRFGVIQLDGVDLKDFYPDTYKVTFFGNTTQLNVKFGDETLDKLDYIGDTDVKAFSGLSQFDYSYTSANFINTLSNPSFLNGNVITPLINYSDKDWNYGGGNGDAVNDISITSGAILDSTLRPAIRVIKLIEAIETKYNVTFSRDFLDKATFQDLYMWLNERTESLLTQVQEPNINISFTGTNNGYFTQNGNVLLVKRRKYSEDIFTVYRTSVKYTVRPTNLTIKYSLIIENENGIELARINDVTGNRSIEKITSAILGNNSSNELVTDSYVLKIITQGPNTFEIDVNVQSIRLSNGTTVYVNVFSINNISTLNVSLIIGDNIPKMKVIDFITSIMKMFKLIIRPITTTDFYIDTIDSFYSKGNILDITDYADQSQVKIERPVIYSDIRFQFEKTDNFLGKKFRIDNNPITEIGYGDLQSIYPQIENKKELKVDVNFENMLFENISDNNGVLLNIMTGLAASSTDDGRTFSPNKSKPILFYNNGINNHVDSPIEFKFNNTSLVDPIVYSYNIGNTNNEYLEQVTDSVNFGVERDQWHQQDIVTNLFSNYWSNWINTIYDLKQRKVKLKSFLPQRFINELSLNDRLIIGDQRFKISDYTINLVTSEVELNLFKDIYTATLPIEMNAMTLSGFTYLTDWAATPNGNAAYIYGNQQPGFITQVNFDGSQNTNFNIGSGFNANSFGFQSLLIDGDKLLVTGNFTSYNSVSKNRLIRLNQNGSIDTTFNIGTGFNNYSLKSLKTINDKYIIVGNFTQYSGVTNNRIISLNQNGSRNTAFTTGTGFNNTAVDIATDGSNLFVSGYFTQYSGLSRNRIIKLDASGNVITAFDGGSGPNTTTAQPNGLIYNQNGLYMYGYMTSYSGVSVGRICKIDETTGQLDQTFNLSGTGFNNTVFIAKTIYNDKLLCTGSFSAYNGTVVSRNVVLNGDGSLYYALPSGFTYVYSIDNNIYGIPSSGEIQLISEFNQDSISNEFIVTNAGIKHYDFQITTNKSWVINKVDTGYDIDWVTFVQNGSGDGSAVVTIRIEEKATQAAPEVYEPRTMTLEILFNDGSRKYIYITQLGLIDSTP